MPEARTASRKYLKEKSVLHVWHATDHGHDPPEWKQALYQLSQKVFQ